MVKSTCNPFEMGIVTGNHETIFRLMTDHLENVPGLQPIHFLLYERAAYLYSELLSMEDEKVEKVYLGMFIDAMNEIGRCTREYSKDDTVQDSLLFTVASVLRSELADNPDLLKRVTRRLMEL